MDVVILVFYKICEVIIIYITSETINLHQVLKIFTFFVKFFHTGNFLFIILASYYSKLYKNQPCDAIKMWHDRRSGKVNP